MSPIMVKFKIWEYYHNKAKASVVLVMYREKKLNREQIKAVVNFMCVVIRRATTLW